MGAASDPLGRASGGGLKIPGVPLGRAAKGLPRLGGVAEEGSSEAEKSGSKSLVTALGSSSGVRADSGDDVSSAARKDEPKRSFLGGCCVKAASLAW